MLEIVVDNFAGGGGASSGIEAAIGRPIDIAINHDIVAIRMHKVNHPHTKHYCESVWDVDPVEACAGRQVSLAWFSPDCKHFSKAKGGRPVDKKIRGLAWVALKWAAKVKPRVIILENVEEFITWGPLEKSEDGGYRPCTKKKGRTFTAFINALKRHGYIVDYTELRGCDYGAPTIRRRLFLVARSDGRSIIWPEPTHGDPKSEDVKSGRLKPWRVAAECIHWDLACPSIFERKRPLADATQRRIAKGIMKYAVKSPNPFIVTYYGEKHANDFRGQSLEEPLRTQTTENRHGLIVPYIAPLTHQGSDRTRDIREPFPVVTGAHRGELALVAPYMIRTDMHKSNAGCNYDSREPLRTVTSSGGHALVSAFLAKHYSGVIGSEMDTPVGTVTAIDHHSLVTAFLARHMGCSIGSDLFEPARTLLQNNKDSLVTSHIIKLKVPWTVFIGRKDQSALCSVSDPRPAASPCVQAQRAAAHSAVPSSSVGG